LRGTGTPRSRSHANLRAGRADAGVIDALELIRVQPWAVETTVFGTNLHVMVAAENEGAPLIRRTLKDAGIEVVSIERIMPSLEDVFLYVLEHGDPCHRGFPGAEAAVRFWKSLRPIVLRSSVRSGATPRRSGCSWCSPRR